MRKTRMYTLVDEPNKRIVFRFIGHEPAENIPYMIEQVLSCLKAPWDYDFLFDLHRYENGGKEEEIEAFGHWLKTYMADRDAGRATVVIAQDPTIWRRGKLYEAATPWRTHRMFYTNDEGLAWLEEGRGDRHG